MSKDLEAPSVPTGGAAPDLTQAIRDRVRRIVGCTNPAPCAICARAAEIIELDLAAVTRQRDEARAALEPLEQAMLAERAHWDEWARICKKLTAWAKAIATVRDRLTDQGR